MTNSARRRRPRRLQYGDTIAIVAPAGPVPPEQLGAGVRILRQWGLHVELGKHVTDRHPRLDYLAGTDADRAADLQAAWCDPNTAGVLCARGGYGTMRLLDHLDWTAMAAAEPKLLVGSSDVTALHEAIAAKLGLVTVFGPMIGTKAFVGDQVAREQLRRLLFAPDSARRLAGGAQAQALIPGKAEGITYGGNLSLLAGMLGSSDMPPPPGPGIALLEDVTEEPYQLDRYLTQLLRAGWFDNATGIALGSWTKCGEPDQVRATMLDVFAEVAVPTLWELGFGHCAGQHSVPLGVAAELNADTCELVVDTCLE